jgi:2-dehydrotetronate isomerase
MPRFAANLSFLYNELPFLERFAAAAADGFEGVEFLFPYAWDTAVLAKHLTKYGLKQVLLNAPPGGGDLQAMAQAWEARERGTACLPGREEEFQAGFMQALRYAQALQCPRIHVMAGCVPVGVAQDELLATYVRNLRWAAQQAQAIGCGVLIEPINQRDMPGYFLTHQAQAHAVRAAVAEDNLQVQMDLYHCQVTEGDVATKLRQYLPGGGVGHIQIASVPDRQEPDGGELNYGFLLPLLDTLGYTGWVGCEYRPRRGAQVGATRAGLGWRSACLCPSSAG